MRSGNFKLVCGALVLTAASHSARAVTATFNAVSALDPNNGGSVTVVDAASNSTTNGVTLAAFTSLVSTAYSANAGGVVNFEAAQLTTGNAPNTTIGESSSAPLNAIYGTTGSKTLSFYRSDAASSSSAAIDYNTNQGALLASGATGGGYLGIQGTSTYSLTFIEPLADFGLTFLPRADGQTRTTQFTIHYNDSTTSTSSLETTNPSGQSTTTVFFGFAAPAGKTITSIDDANPSASRFDDLAFVVAPVPEPATLGLMGLGMLGMLRRKR